VNFTDVIQQWFKEEGGSLVLPDGWYGRPYDSQHSLTAVEHNDETLTVVLDDVLKLRFTGLKLIEARPEGLVFGPFSCLDFEWEGFGKSKQRGIRHYHSGEVKIMRALGR
jgi:hypothetical protein